MKTIQIFDPAMCCETGVCGPSVDPHLAQFAADLEWLRAQGFRVERYNLAAQPGMFAATPAVKDALHADGPACLPMILCDGELVSKGKYPTRSTLAHRVGASQSPSLSVVATPCCGPAKPGDTGSGCC